ncbi:lipocalin family protein [Winogradskyella maritima]|uniref:Lipocalin family protein n=1 Tax=Winogradskyella maritima TaxID=1517766 RepID=A0ABV8AL51_9FLAO|nr:lipocalin family protein [Winogradskyella maritima]
MKIYYRLIVLVFLALAIESCGSEKFELPGNATQLLTNGNEKVWKLAERYNDGHRMNMGDCFLSYRVTYASDGTTTDNNPEYEDCGPSMDADWSFYTNDDGSYIKLKGEKVKTLLNQDKDYKFFKIEALSDSLLIINFRHKQFGNKERLITDHLVPEDIMVVGRDYHN